MCKGGIVFAAFEDDVLLLIIDDGHDACAGFEEIDVNSIGYSDAVSVCEAFCGWIHVRYLVSDQRPTW